MATASEYPHLTHRDDGSVHIGQTRYQVVHLAAEHYHYGWTAEELLRQHPDLRPEEVYSALAYFYDHFDELVRQFGTTRDGATGAQHTGAAFSREELISAKRSERVIC